MAIFYLMVGIPGSGKSTVAKQIAKVNNAVIISSDEIRNMHPDWPEANVFPEVYRLSGELYKNGQNVVLDATNITEKVRSRTIDNIKKYIENPYIVAVSVETDVDTCRTRVKIRNKNENERYLPVSVIESYKKSFQIPSFKEEIFEIYRYDNNGFEPKEIEHLKK